MSAAVATGGGVVELDLLLADLTLHPLGVGAPQAQTGRGPCSASVVKVVAGARVP